MQEIDAVESLDPVQHLVCQKESGLQTESSSVISQEIFESGSQILESHDEELILNTTLKQLREARLIGQILQNFSLSINILQRN